MPNDLIANNITADFVASALINEGAYRVAKTMDRSLWFKWKCGIVAPAYCNVRELASSPLGRNVAVSGLMNALQDYFPDAEGFLGTATAGIPWASVAAHLSNLPMGYVRVTPKEHGLGKEVEYFNKTKRRIVILDDLVASGQSTQSAIKAAESSGLIVEGILSIVNWGFPEMRERLHGYRVKSLVSFPQIVPRLGLPEDGQADLMSFYRNPERHEWFSETFGIDALKEVE